METETSRTILIGLAGFGYMGQQRLRALNSIIEEDKKRMEVVGIFDPSYPNVDSNKEFRNVKFLTSFEELLTKKPNWIIIATPHNVALPLCKKALSKDIKVFMEKPLGRNYDEACNLISAQKYDNQLWVGFNYRFFDGIGELIKDIKSNLFGSLISINITMGHGGEPGYENSWKVGSIESGGGVLINEGIHLLDLCLILAGKDVKVESGLSYSGFWGTGFDEECHIMLRSETVPLINLQISIVKWRSTFRIEVYGKEGYGIVEGRGRSYGIQHYKRGKKWGWRSGKAQSETEEVVCQDDGSEVFKKELIEVFSQPNSNSIKPCSAKSAIDTMKLFSECRKKIKILN